MLHESYYLRINVENVMLCEHFRPHLDLLVRWWWYCVVVRNSWNSFKSMASVFVLETDTPHPNRGENRFVAKPPLADFITCHEMLRCTLVGKVPY